jgi:peptide/nickel transport system permease protein
VGRYIVRRLLQSIPLLIGISIIVFIMLQMTPGGPLAAFENPGATGRANPEELERMRARYGLDDPLYIQYLKWAGDLVRGDWGTSFTSGRPVLTVILERLPVTLTVTVIAFVLTILLAFPIGIIAAVKQYTLFDYFFTTVSFLGISVPRFWSALMLLFIFTFSLNWLPATGLYDARYDYTGLAMVRDRALHLILPVSVMTFYLFAQLTRYVRASMLEVLYRDYVRTARAKGLAERPIILFHAMRNGMIPVITVLALYIPDLFVGSVIVESIFAIPGMGRLFIDSAHSRDYPVLMGIVMLTAIIVILSNLIADVIYGLLDPRIRYN